MSKFVKALKTIAKKEWNGGCSIDTKKQDMLNIYGNAAMTHKPVDVAEHVSSHLLSLDGVSGIVVKQKHPDEFEVGIFLSNFEQKVRRSIYEQERALYELFPKSSFHFLVIDASENANPTAVER